MSDDLEDTWDITATVQGRGDEDPDLREEGSLSGVSEGKSLISGSGTGHGKSPR